MRLAVALLCLVCAGTAPATAQVRLTSVVFGRVVADATGAGLPRVRVSALLDAGTPLEPVFTDEQGWFTVDVPDAAPMTLAVFKAGFAAHRRTGVVGSRSALVPIEIRLPRGGAITGTVRAGGRPALGAEVRVRRVGADAGDLVFQAVVDDRGVYRVGGLAEGDYEVVAGDAPAPAESASTFARLTDIDHRLRTWLFASPSAVAATAPARVATVRAEGDARADFMVGVRPASAPDAADSAPPVPDAHGGALAGTVIDEFGDPVAGVRVEAVRVGNGPDAVAPPAIPAVLTDDQGAYRLFGLTPGAYVVRVSTDAIVSGSVSRADQGLAPVYFPGIPSPGWATPVVVRLGREETSIDAVLSPSLASRVSGRVVDEAGRPVRGTVRLLPAARQWGGAADLAPMPLQPDGRFTFVNVPPGEYLVRVSAQAGTGQATLDTVAHVSVLDGDPPPMTVVAGAASGAAR